MSDMTTCLLCDRPAIRYNKTLCASHGGKKDAGQDPSTLKRKAPGEWGDWYLTNGYRRRSRIINGVKEHQLEHREMLQQKLGRELILGENVHHINGVKDDNRPENLELWSTSQPAGQRVEDKLAWAEEFLELYGYIVTKGEI